MHTAKARAGPQAKQQASCQIRRDETQICRGHEEVSGVRLVTRCAQSQHSGGRGATVVRGDACRPQKG